MRRRLLSSGARHRVPCAAGDGIGPELLAAAQRVVRGSGAAVEWLEVPLGREQALNRGRPAHCTLPEGSIRAAESYGTLLKGPVTIPPGDAAAACEARGRRFTSPNNALRQLLALHANVRPARSPNLGGDRAVDLIVVRENTEDVYTGLEQPQGDPRGEEYAVHLTKIISRRASRRVAEAAFAVARREGRRRVTAVHKANVCKLSDGLFLETCREVAALHPDVAFDDQLADSLLASLVRRPAAHDVLVCPNLFGDLISDMAGGLAGSLGLLPSGQYAGLPGEGPAGGPAVFEPAHGSAPDLAGLGAANPTSMIRSAAMLLDHLGEASAARRVAAAVDAALADPRGPLTRDLGGDATTEQFTDAVCRHLDAAEE